MKNNIVHLSLILLLSACTTSPKVSWMVTTPEKSFSESPLEAPNQGKVATKVEILTTSPEQTIKGFGACFNELGWDALMALDSTERATIMAELFDPEIGSAFTVCRMPVGANDFSRDWYSYNETDGDFGMSNFSVAHDTTTLIPFIKTALKFNDSLYIWASPWSPPTWMKRNGHYAMDTNSSSIYANGLKATQRGAEGVDFFKLEPRYLAAYADYFGRFVEQYRGHGIEIKAVAPQNEFNSCQIFPSCSWTARGLSEFMGSYLAPRMDSMGVELWVGTVERKNDLLVDTVLKSCPGQVKAVAFQWAGKEAVAQVHKNHPEMAIVQSESECGDGQNSWEFCFYTWSLVKHYMRQGASIYEYWNIALKDNGLSRWGWRQNSLVSVDADKGTFRYNPEYYLMKHLSHYVKPGARHLPTQGEYDDILAFKNPDGQTVVMAVNPTTEQTTIEVKCNKSIFTATLEPQSINTFTL